VNPEFGPWNPGIRSELPRRLLPLCTLFRPENAFSTVEEVRELSRATGLAEDELVRFRPERLVVHELLVRVTADVSVPDGPRVEDLGIHFREMTRTILARYLEPRMREIAAAYRALEREIAALIDAELAAALSGLSAGAGAGDARAASAGGLLRWLRPGRRRAGPGAGERWVREDEIARAWAEKAHSAGAPLARAAYRALARVASAVLGRHGRLWGDRSLLAPIAAGIACNEHASEAVGAMIEPWLAQAAAREGYLVLPAQRRPVVMNTKGAPASGKSTMRPLQRALAARIGARWDEFALISPDIWRKFLLDYDSLGEHYKYAGAFTARELAIVDQKLDRHMARKAEHGGMSHLLIDRFRFDSFAPDSDEAGSNLLTRFGHTVYLFFMITPPHETVERSWKRGLEVGRYKAVDDVLAQNIEAYAGMPELFFTWALRPGKLVHYEFLDNGVPLGERPRTVAFGWNGEMNVLDVKCMLDVDRYRRINVNAADARAVYPGGEAMAAENNTGFLARCARELAALNFAHRDTGRIYARVERGRLAWSDPEALGHALQDGDTRAGLAALAPALVRGPGRTAAGRERRNVFLEARRFHTLGQWGGALEGSPAGVVRPS
jgi:hypothetical protein